MIQVTLALIAYFSKYDSARELELYLYVGKARNCWEFLAETVQINGGHYAV